MKNYQISRQESSFNSEYAHLYITVKLEINDNREKEVTFTWQGNTGEEHWYACRAEVNSDNPDTFTHAAKLLKKIKVGFGTQPEHVIKCLEEMNYKRVAYHRGRHELYPVDKWPEGKTWTCRAEGSKYNLASVIAKTEYDAKRKLRQKAAKAIEKHGSDMKEWVSWLNTGMLTHETHPEYLPEAINLELTPKTTAELAS